MLTDVFVSQSLIYAGEPKLCRYCPLSLAIEQVVKDGIAVSVYKYSVVFRDDLTNEFIAILPLPKEMTNFVLDVDRKGKDAVGPTLFQLDIPKELLREQV